jgi:glycerol-3-phosphate cytidylyltransferase-like family protein
MSKETKKFWESDSQKQIRKDLIKNINFGDHLLSDEDFDIDFQWLKNHDVDLSVADETEH